MISDEKDDTYIERIIILRANSMFKAIKLREFFEDQKNEIIFCLFGKKESCFFTVHKIKKISAFLT